MNPCVCVNCDQGAVAPAENPEWCRSCWWYSEDFRSRLEQVSIKAGELSIWKTTQKNRNGQTEESVRTARGGESAKTNTQKITVFEAGSLF